MTATPIPVRPRERRQRVQAAETGMAVLKALAELGGRASLTLLAGAVEESPAKVHRYLVSLMEAGLVNQDTATQQYYLGLESLLLGLAAMRQADPIRMAEASLVRLREELEVTCFVAVMGNKGPTIVRFEEPGLPVTVNVRVGSVMPLLWSATGRALLATLDESAVRALALAELDSAPPGRRAPVLEAERAELVQELVAVGDAREHLFDAGVEARGGGVRKEGGQVRAGGALGRLGHDVEDGGVRGYELLAHEFL